VLDQRPHGRAIAAIRQLVDLQVTRAMTLHSRRTAR
jgi:hypothetical protein